MMKRGNQPQDFLAENPPGKIPLLVLDAGTLIAEPMAMPLPGAQPDRISHRMMRVNNITNAIGSKLLVRIERVVPVFLKCSVVSLLIFLTACTAVPMVRVESANQNSRIDYVVIHATSENFAESMRLLTTRTANPVSAHYLVPAPDDPTYTSNSLRVYSLVPEHRRAWHAGLSHWGGEEALNDRSIGIEIVNEFECTAPDIPPDEIQFHEVNCQFLPYPEEQMQLLIRLLKEIQGDNPQIDPIDIIGHSDIAITRRSDPGPLFPWHRLYQEGIGAWPDADVAARYRDAFTGNLPSAQQIQAALLALGYQVEITGEMDNQARFALRAFQLHFRPDSFSGRADAETVSLLWALLEKYRPERLAELDELGQRTLP